MLFRSEPGTLQEKIFTGLSQLEQIRRTRKVFDSSADVYTYDVKDEAVLGILRENEEERFLGLFNFSDEDRTAWLTEEGEFTDLITGACGTLENPVVKGHGFLWLSREISNNCLFSCG